jgi:hypothetical protein
MSGLQGYALVEQVDKEVVAAYAASDQTFPAVASGSGWFVCGAFFLPKTIMCLLEVIGSVSHSSLTGSARLVDVDTGLEVSGSLIVFTGQNDARFLSGSFQMTGNKKYWVQGQAVGSTGVDRFGIVRTASLVGP